MTIGITSAGLTTAAPFIGAGVKAVTGIGSARTTSGAARDAARLQTDAANRAAQLQSESAADQLAYVKGQSELDRLSKRWSDEQNFGLSQARELSDFHRYGDTATNRRAELVAAGLTEDRRRGDTQRSLNTMRALMGMPNKSLVSFVQPDALRLTAPTQPEYVEDPTPYTADDVGVVPTTNARRLV